MTAKWGQAVARGAIAATVVSACATSPPARPEDYSPPSARPTSPPDAGVDPCQGHDPIAYGECDIAQALAATHSAASVVVETADIPGAQEALAASGVALDPGSESFALLPMSSGARVIGRDPVGAMYGAFQLAEWLRLDGASALPLASPRVASPATAIRSANLFLTLPDASDSPWWFLDAGFWDEYLALLAHARLNFLDLHGMYDLDSTLFPNALLYFATSASHPEIGVSADDRRRNVTMLARVVGMAKSRGIDVGLMTYRSDASPTATGSSPPDDVMQVYTREAAQDLATRVPQLRRLGFRIGESGRPASFYTSTFVAGVRAAGTGMGIDTRTWLAPKVDIESIVHAAGPDTLVEAKYNGEQLALPYVIAGGRMDGQWSAYSYEDYLDSPVDYPFLWQVRAGGTHRIFRQASYERARRVASSYALSPFARGFTVEAAHAYFPQRDFYHASSQDQFSPWTFRRDELFYLLFGRLAYDPSTPERPFRAQLALRVGTDGLWDAVQAASEVVPWIQASNTCGPDQRDFAPELELGGPVGYWASAASTSPPPGSCASVHSPFDTFAIASPADLAADLVAGVGTSRVSPLAIAQKVLAAATVAASASTVAIDGSNAEARDVVRECVALADLGGYFAHKLRGASALAVYAATAAPDYLQAARSETALADDAFQHLADDTMYIAPFADHLRMAQLDLIPFHWKNEVPLLAADAASIDALVAQVASAPPTFSGTVPPAQAWLEQQRGAGPGLDSLTVSPDDPAAPAWTVTAKLGGSLPSGARVNVLWKPFQASSDWQSLPAEAQGTAFVAEVTGGGAGALFAIEVVGGPGVGWRYPDVLAGAPYVALAPR